MKALLKSTVFSLIIISRFLAFCFSRHYTQLQTHKIVVDGIFFLSLVEKKSRTDPVEDDAKHIFPLGILAAHYGCVMATRADSEPSLC